MNITFNIEAGKTGSFEFLNESSEAIAFHKSFPQYKETPLHSLKSFAGNIGVKNVYLKDESLRFGLNAFKVLGGSYAIAKYIAETLLKSVGELPFDTLISGEIKKRLGDMTFVTATDGNHGKGVAWTARVLGHKSAVFMPDGSSEKRLNSILKEGAHAEITNMNYDDAVRYADEYAKRTGGVLIQDTAFSGYEKIPKWIMTGYGTIALEIIEQLKSISERPPTHIFLQAGVGSFAAAIIGSLAVLGQYPYTVIVEPDAADCLYKSAVNGKCVAVGGNMPTIMAGLACGEVNPIAWDIIKSRAHAFVSCPDYIAANGMRILGNPLDNDHRVISGESGAVTLGFLHKVMTDENYAGYKTKLNLNGDSSVLLISTEGSTDESVYRDVVWHGKHSNNFK